MRAQELQLPIWVPPTPPTSLSPAARARAEWELNEARHELQRVYQMTACELWRQDLYRVMPLLLQQWDAPVWRKKMG